MNDAVSRYHNFLEKLEAYPEWKDKVVEEVGKWFLMIHNNLAEGDTKRELFSKMVFKSLFRTDKSISFDDHYSPNHKATYSYYTTHHPTLPSTLFN